jgi:putative ABC transport system permease protein
VDLLSSLRTLRRSPAALLSLALGIGANTAIFSVVSALLLRPLPYRDADRLVIVWNRSPGIGIAEDWFSTAQYFDVKTAHPGFEDLAIAIGANYNLTGEGEPERIGTVRTSSNLLPMLGVGAYRGRLFTPDEDTPGKPGTALLRYGTWMRRYGGDPNVIGRSLTLNGQPYQIVGILPESFTLPREVMPTLGGAENAEIVIPLPLPADAPRIRNREDYNIVGRLKRGVTLAQAQADMDAITARLRREHPDFYPPNGGLTFDIVPLHEQVVGDVRRSLMVLTASVGLVLLIACANVANLQLSRALARQREIAVRAALGASRARIVRQLLTESVVLAIAGGALGVVISVWSVQAIQRLGAGSVPRLAEIAVDLRVLSFTLLLSICSGVLFGLAPALRVSRLDLHGSLKDVGRGGSSPGSIWGRGQNVRRLLVVSELALSAVLLIGAGLLIRSFIRLQEVPPGFNPNDTLTLELTMTGRKYNDVQAVLNTYRQLWTKLATLPGVTAVGGVSALPLSEMFAWGPIVVEGRTPQPGESFINADQRIVAADYFRAMEIPLVEGRLFTEQDTQSAPRVAIADAHMAAQLWPNESAVGKRIRTGGIDANANAPWITIVGVVGRVKQYTLDAESRMAFYRAHTQSPSRGMNIVIRTAGGAGSLTATATRTVREIDPDLPVYNVRTMTDRVAASLAERRFSMLLLAVFAGLALGLASIGIYGVVAYLVSQGTREVGIRIALGATPEAIMKLIVGHGLAFGLIGVSAGLAAAFVLTRFMRSLLFGVGALDPVTFAAIAGLLLAVSTFASYVPARRAARVDPSVSLRAE